MVGAGPSAFAKRFGVTGVMQGVFGVIATGGVQGVFGAIATGGVQGVQGDGMRMAGSQA